MVSQSSLQYTHGGKKYRTAKFCPDFLSPNMGGKIHFDPLNVPSPMIFTHLTMATIILIQTKMLILPSKLSSCPVCVKEQ